MLLALDTSTKLAGLALYDGEMVRAEVTWQARRFHTTWLAPAIEQALQRIHATASDLSAVGVTRGPGSFTGLRVAMSLAKGIAVARDLPIIAVGTLDVMAYPHLGNGHALCVALAAGRGRHAYAFYETDATDEMLNGTPPKIADITALAEAITDYKREGTLRIIGEFTPVEQKKLLELTSIKDIELVSPALALRRPAALAELAWKRLSKGQTDNLHTLEPIYFSLKPR
jgi:tRNA threonylcarbamoyladenosine biosynthesis protein TsaB